MRIRQLLLLIVTCTLSACINREADAVKPCLNAGAFVKRATKLSGFVFYNSAEKLYGIQVPTSMNSADMGIVCDLPVGYQQVGSKVQFSGAYYAYTKSIALPVGYKTYYLALETITNQHLSKLIRGPQTDWFDVSRLIRSVFGKADAPSVISFGSFGSGKRVPILVTIMRLFTQMMAQDACAV